MKTLLILLLALAFAPEAYSAPKKPVTVKLPEVVRQVRNRNYKVQVATMRTYQAKANIEKARADLLPRLNIWSIAKIILDPTSILDSIQDIAPFLVPANWSRLEQNKVLYRAEQEGYRALWSNEVHVTKMLYMRILFDQKLLNHVSASVKSLEEVLEIVKFHETFGAVKPGTARDIEVRVLGLKEDEQNLRLLIAQEIDELSYALAIKADVQMVLAPVTMPDAPSLKAIDYKAYEARVVSISPERRQYSYFLETLEYIRQEVHYSFFGSSPISRGVAGGIFDAIPQTSGVFGKNATMKIVDAQREILITQRTGIEETVRRQLRALANQYNSDLQMHSQYSRRLQLARESNEALLRRAELGEQLNATEFSDNVKTRIQAETAIFAMQYRLFSNIDRLQRLTFTADYAK